MRPVFHPWLAAALEVHGLVLAYLALYFYHRLPWSDSPDATQLFLIGAILVMGAFAGHLAKRLHLPKITGYLVVGALASPSLPALWPAIGLPELVSRTQAKDLKLVNDLAIGLIALMAGAEIRIGWLRARAASIARLSLYVIAVVGVLCTGAILAAEHLPPALRMPFLAEAVAGGAPAWMVAALAAMVVVANSPTVVVSVLKERRADGPLSNTVIGTAVVMDAMVLSAFSMLLALIAAAAGDGGRGVAAEGGAVAASILVSIAVGALLGLGLRVFTERSDRRLGWMLIGLALAVAVLGPLLHLKPLFCLLAAGFACENLGAASRTARGTHRLESALKRVANPVFVIFFVVAGLNLDLVALADFWPLVVALSLLRAGGVWLAAHVSLAGTEPAVRRYAWLGLLPKAGVTLALAQLTAQRFPGWGGTLETLMVAMVGLHELLAPVLFSWALRRAGEAKA